MTWIEKKRYLEFCVFMFVNFDPLYAYSQEEIEEGRRRGRKQPKSIELSWSVWSLWIRFILAAKAHHQRKLIRPKRESLWIYLLCNSVAEKLSLVIFIFVGTTGNIHSSQKNEEEEEEEDENTLVSQTINA